MLKSEARQFYKEKRSSLTLKDRMKIDDLLLIQLQTAELPFITFLLSYWPLEETNEPNTHLFTDYLEFQNPEIVVCYPKTDFSSLVMQSMQTNDDTRFRKNQYNIYEPQDGEAVNPEAMDIVFVPLLAFDKRGYRVGYGKGVYDRYLSQCRADCMKIGFSYFEPLDSIDDSHEFDVPLDLCVTPTSVYVF
jgi:5-formyltetrahydrofolate cyclo-ligase